MLYKKLGRMDDAVCVWRSLLTESSIKPFVELAKYYEHRVRDLSLARDIVMVGMDRVNAGAIEHLWPNDLLHELQYRLDRIERRLKRAHAAD